MTSKWSHNDYKTILMWAQKAIEIAPTLSQSHLKIILYIHKYLYMYIRLYTMYIKRSIWFLRILKNSSGFTNSIRLSTNSGEFIRMHFDFVTILNACRILVDHQEFRRMHKNPNEFGKHRNPDSGRLIWGVLDYTPTPALYVGFT